MAQIVVRNIRDDVMGDFKELAKKRGRSAEQQVRELIEQEVENVRKRDRFRRLVVQLQDRWREQGVTFEDSTPLIREDRDR